MMTGPNETPYFYAASAENHSPHVIALFTVNEGVLLRIADLGHHSDLADQDTVHNVHQLAEVLISWHEFVALIGDINNEVIPDLVLRATPDGWTVSGA